MLSDYVGYMLGHTVDTYHDIQSIGIDKLRRNLGCSRIVKRVNHRCNDVFGNWLIETKGKKWVFSDFGFEIWGKTREEVETGV